LLLIGVILGTFAWALAFVSIYTRPHTRVAATRWIYANIPGPINLRIRTAQGLYQQPLAFGGMVTNTEQVLPFIAEASGQLEEMYFPHIAAPSAPQTLNLILSLEPGAPRSKAWAPSPSAGIGYRAAMCAAQKHICGSPSHSRSSRDGHTICAFRRRAICN
jgi:hypothetical protein